MATTYGWLVSFNDRQAGRTKVTTQPGHDVLGAISSVLRYNPQCEITDIIEVRQEGELPSE